MSQSGFTLTVLGIHLQGRDYRCVPTLLAVFIPLWSPMVSSANKQKGSTIFFIVAVIGYGVCICFSVCTCLNKLPFGDIRKTQDYWAVLSRFNGYPFVNVGVALVGLELTMWTWLFSKWGTCLCLSSGITGMGCWVGPVAVLVPDLVWYKA